MNQIVLSGNLTAEIEIRDVGEHHLSVFTLACNEGERVVFMPVEAWNMPHLAEHLGKGSKALVSGSLKQEQWEADGGGKRSRLVLTAYRVEFIGAPKEGGSPRKAGNGRKNYGRKPRPAGAR